MTASERGRAIWKLADLIEQHGEEFAQLEGGQVRGLPADGLAHDPAQAFTPGNAVRLYLRPEDIGVHVNGGAPAGAQTLNGIGQRLLADLASATSTPASSKSSRAIAKAPRSS